jgi:hypothetical protein
MHHLLKRSVKFLTCELLSLKPRFSGVLVASEHGVNCFNSFYPMSETVKTVPETVRAYPTLLKQGVNEMGCSSQHALLL